MKNYLINRASEAKKKTVLTVVVFAAMTVAAHAASYQPTNLADETQVTLAGNRTSQTEDVYRDYALNSEENDKHITRFYDVDRIVIQNKHHALIRIYDNNWQLIEQTRNDVDKTVRPGDYYVTCTSPIRSAYK